MDRRKRFLTMLVCFVLAAFMLTACAGGGAPAATESVAAGQGADHERAHAVAHEKGIRCDAVGGEIVFEQCALKG